MPCAAYASSDQLPLAVPVLALLAQVDDGGHALGVQGGDVVGPERHGAGQQRVAEPVSS